MAKTSILHVIKKEVAPADWSKFLVIYQNESELKQSAGFEARDDAYVMVLDPTGGVQYKLHGAVNAASVRDVSNHIAAVLGNSKPFQ
jgi:predicted transcriptional regulator